MKNIRNIFVPIFDHKHWHLIIVSMTDRTMTHMGTHRHIASYTTECDRGQYLHAYLATRFEDHNINKWTKITERCRKGKD